MLNFEIRAGEKSFKSVGHQGLRNQVNPVVRRKSEAALFISISNLASELILSRQGNQFR
jgi:hypothetical protein